jgi:OpgC protein
MGRYSLPVFATGSVLAALGEVIVETRAAAFSHRLALGGILVHYLVARLLTACRAAQPRPVLAVMQWHRAH